VLVRFGAVLRPERFALLVVRRGAEAPIVKRAVGLPGESIGISGGDLVVNGERLPLEAPRPPPVAVFDDALLEVRDYFMMRAQPGDPWRSEGDAWRLEAADVPAGSDAGMMLFQKELRDDYIGEDGRRVVGRVEVNDARIECEVAADGVPDGASGTLRFRLVEAGDTFEARIALAEGNRATATIVRFNSRSLRDTEGEGGRILVLAERTIELVEGAWIRIAFENVDNHLVLDVGDARIAADYKANEPHAGPTAAGTTSVGPRVALGGEACRARFRAIRVLRDLYYVPLGRHAVTQPLVLGPEEIFVLGDNSSDSRDSRTFGPIRASDIIGRPTRIVWPLDRARPLQGAVPR
jgi:type IV secretory pathway protease TraF